MRLPLQHLLAPVLVATLGLGGVSFAVTAADDQAPAQEEVVTPEPTDDADPTTEPSPSNEPVPTDAPPSEEPDPTDAPPSDEPAPTDAPPSEEPVVDPAPSPSDDVSDDASDGKKMRSTDGCPEGFTGNHGQYVSGTDEKPRKDAAHSDCGKPVKSDDE